MSMEELLFRTWMNENGYKPDVVASRTSNCQRIERNLNINLDVIFARGESSTLLQKFEYSAADARRNILPRHGIPIDGDQYTGTATLRSALKLYFDFKAEHNGIAQVSVAEPRNKRVITPRTDTGYVSQRSAIISPDGETKPIDSYQQFCDDFHITPDELYQFGIRRSIFATPEEAWNQWQSIKRALQGEGELKIRKYGRAESNPFISMYKQIFPQAQISIDTNGNSSPRAIIQKVTNRTINDTIFNFEVSHVFGYTKNPLLFNAAWNFFFCPKLIDPFTGHTSKGRWPEEYQPLLRESVLTKFSRCISDYNKMLTEMRILELIENYLADLDWGTENAKELARFKEDARKEWQPITNTES